MSLSGEDLPPQSKKLASLHIHGKDTESVMSLDDEPDMSEDNDDYNYELEEEEAPSWLLGPTARYLFAGGVAGAGNLNN